MSLEVAVVLRIWCHFSVPVAPDHKGCLHIVTCFGQQVLQHFSFSEAIIYELLTRERERKKYVPERVRRADQYVQC